MLPHAKPLIAATLPLVWLLCALSAAQTAEDPTIYTYKIVNTFPHDQAAFTQGLAFDDGYLFEGTGLYGRSTLRKVELKSGRVVKLYDLPARVFGEGVTVFGEHIIQITWRSNVAFVYDKRSFKLRQTLTYPSEGWGLTHDGTYLILSDGTAVLRFLDPRTFREVDRIEVFDNNGPVTRLNELEYARGQVLANVWGTDRIARISPATGRVTAWIDLSGLLSDEDQSETVDVLNGIAYDAEGDRLFVTGKLWPKLFEIKPVLPQ
ncbi:MAG: glutaminyl-peptide cyclotransferase [Acidiferrobacterales bacterium]